MFNVFIDQQLQGTKAEFTVPLSYNRLFSDLLHSMMPESPENSTASIMTSPPTMSASASHKTPSSALNGTLSPHSHSSSDSPSPPMLTSTSSGGIGSVGNGPVMNGSASNSSVLQPNMNGTSSRPRELQATTCGARQLSKVKRFLTTLQQFGSDISAEAGERVRNLILNLVVSHSFLDYFTSAVGIKRKACFFSFL